MSDEDVSLSALALVHEREIAELGTAAGDLAKLAVLHDKELEAVRDALPVAFKELGAHLGDQLSDLTTRHAERTQALLLTKQGVIAHELGLTATREVASRIGAVREELAKDSETSLARLITTHQSKLGELRPLMTDLAREEAERVTRHALTGLPDVKDFFRKELAALPNVGMQLVRANKGNWKPTEIYNAGDIIFFRGSSYLVLRQTKRGEFPTQANQNKPTATFQILAAAGAPGMSPLSTELDSKLTSVSVALANGFAGTSSGGTTPILTISTTVTGIIKGDGTALSAAAAGDFPTLNQNTTGSAATLTTPRAIYGNNFDGSAALTQIIASTFGGTGNGFTKFTGPATAERTFTLPNQDATLLYSGGALGTPSSGTVTNMTGTASININGTVGATTPNTGGFTTLSATGLILTTNNGAVEGDLPIANAYRIAAMYDGNALTGMFSFGGAVNYQGAKANGSKSSPTATALNDRLCAVSGMGYNTTSGWGNGNGTASVLMGMYAGEAHTNTNQGGYLTVEVTPNGSTAASRTAVANFSSTGLAVTGGLSATTGINSTAIGASTPSTGAFTTLAANAGISNTGGQVSQTATVAAGSYGMRVLGVAGADRDVLLAGVSGVSNGLTVQSVSGNMVYTFGLASGNVMLANSTGLAVTGVISTTDPAGGAGPNWKLGVAASVSPTAPNRTVRIDIAGTSYYLAAKTTND